MKKLLSLAVILLGIAAAANTAHAAVSIGISIGDNRHHGFRPPVILPPLPPLPRLPVIIGRPHVVIAAPPRVVVADACHAHTHYDRGHGRACDYRPAPRHYNSHRDDRHDHGYRHK